MACGTSTLKFVSFIFNILCCIFGAMMLSACAYVLVTFAGSDSVRIPCIVGVVLGSLLFLTTILGFCGALHENIRLTWIYTIILLLLLAAQIAVIFLTPVDFHRVAVETIGSAWNRELYGEGTMAEYEQKYFCCGKNGPSDYESSGLIISKSCYKNQDPSIAQDLFEVGCISVLNEEFANASRVELFSDWLLVGIEGTAVIVACMLAISLKNTERRKLYH